MVAFNLKYFLDDAGCKCMFYFHKVGIGASFSTICLLNGFQAFKLNPNICRWMELKIRLPKCIVFCCFLCWILHLWINTCLLTEISGPLNSENLSGENNYVPYQWTMAEKLSLLYTVVYYCCIALFLPLSEFGLHGVCQWLHGPCPAQAQAASPTHS